MQDLQHTVSRRTFLGLQVLALPVALYGCARSDNDEGSTSSTFLDSPASLRTLSNIYQSGFIRIGLHSDNKPFSYINARGNYDGFDQYFCLYLAAAMGVEVRFVSVDPHNRYEKLLNYDIDISISENSPADSGTDGIVYADPLYGLKLGLISLSETAIESIDQLAYGELIVCKGSYAEQYAADAWPDVNLCVYNTISDAKKALEHRKGIALLTDEVSALSWIKDRPDCVLGVRAIGEPRMIAPALIDGNDDLLHAISNIVKEFHGSTCEKDAYKNYIASNTTGVDYTFVLPD